jgi:hypothetical protein
MNRREFVSGALAAGGTVLAGSAVSASRLPGAKARLTETLMQSGTVGAGAAPALEYYELRRYHLRRGPKQALMDAHLRDAEIPAITRAGAGPVGVFNVMIGPESPTLHVLIVHKTLDTFATLGDRLAADAEYQRAGAEYLNAPATDPVFVRVDTWLMRAFAGQPALHLPFGGGEAGKKRRIFELRTYESHSERAALKKIEMFNTGEMAIFHRAGLEPVFFGQKLAGSDMPNLTYMLVYEDMAAHDRQWAAFGSDPEWRKLSTTPGYTDPEIVFNITNLFLRPTAYSQI